MNEEKAWKKKRKIDDDQTVKEISQRKEEREKRKKEKERKKKREKVRSVTWPGAKIYSMIVLTSICILIILHSKRDKRTNGWTSSREKNFGSCRGQKIIAIGCRMYFIPY